MQAYEVFKERKFKFDENLRFSNFLPHTKPKKTKHKKNSLVS